MQNTICIVVKSSIKSCHNFHWHFSKGIPEGKQFITTNNNMVNGLHYKLKKRTMYGVRSVSGSQQLTAVPNGYQLFVIRHNFLHKKLKLKFTQVRNPPQAEFTKKLSAIFVYQTCTNCAFCLHICTDILIFDVLCVLLKGKTQL